MSRTTVGIREAKANLSRYLKSIRQGHEIIITDRGRPVGKIVPLKPAELSLTVRLQQLAESGLVEPGPARQAGTPSPIPLPDDLAQRILQEDRGA